MSNPRNYSLFGLAPVDTATPKPRPGRSYRAARRNEAHDARWPARRRWRNEPHFDGLYLDPAIAYPKQQESVS